ncbi:MAG: hypothetical protein M1831_002061 [Alyxoria varia]|nr:MAG: hypothetical protein M1831_002061 [Alyxoria varia]
MSASINEDAAKSVANQPGQVGSHVPRDGPFETKGHQPGRPTGNEAVPEHQVETHPPGTAPANKTFTPQPNDVPGQANNPAAGGDEGEGVGTSASATLGGATSADVHTGLGHPGGGMTSNEIKHDGSKHREKQGGGLQGTPGAGHRDPSYSTGKRVNDI